MIPRILPLLFITNFTLILGFSIVFPLLPFYAREFGASTFEISVVFAVFPLMQFVFSPIWGKVSDNIGRKPVILVSLVGSAVSFALLGLVGSLTQLLFIRIVHGVFSSTAFGTIFAAGADISTKEDRAKVMGTIGAAFSLAIVFGPAIGGILSSVSIQFPFFVSAAVATLNLVFVYFFVPETIKEKTRKLDLFKGFVLIRVGSALRSTLAPVYLMSSVSYLSFAIVAVAYPLFALDKFDFGPVEVGFVFAGLGITGVVVQGLLVGRVVNRFGEVRVIRVGLIFMMISLGLVAFVLNPILSAVTLSILSIGTALINPSNSSYISKHTKEQGVSLGTLNSFGSLSRFIGPLVVGTIYQVFGPTITFVATTVIIAFGYLLSLRIK